MIEIQVWVPQGNDGDGDLYDGTIEVGRSDTDEISLELRLDETKFKGVTFYVDRFAAGRLAQTLETAAGE